MRTLCELCKKPVHPDELDRDLYLAFGLTEEDLSNHVFYEAVGCEKCGGVYKGRAAIHEALYFTKEVRRLIVKSGREVDEEAVREQAIKDGMWTLRRSGIERIQSGSTTLEEISAVTTEN